MSEEKPFKVIVFGAGCGSAFDGKHFRGQVGQLSFTRIEGVPLKLIEEADVVIEINAQGAIIFHKNRHGITAKVSTDPEPNKSDPALELRQPWWFGECELIKDYMPPYPQKDTKPEFMVKHTPSNMFLRYSHGPKQGHFWDIYGDDYQTKNLALLAISQAPVPPKVGVPIEVREIEAWRTKLRQQRVEIEGLKLQLEDRDRTNKYLNESLEKVNTLVRGFSKR